MSIVLRQGWVPVATLTLEATAAAAGLAAPAPVTAAVHTGIDAPELDGLPCLDIVEGRRVTGERVYSYALRLVPGEPERIFESAPIMGRDEFVRDRIAEVERVIKDPDLTPRQRMSQLQNTGTMLFDQFFPEDMQAYLWEHRDLVHDLIVYTDEPFVPWELVHLKPPPWQARHHAALPRLRRARPLAARQLPAPSRCACAAGTRARICPVYADPMFKNDVGAAEAGYLRDRFGAKAVTATPTGVERLLRGGRFDLLHFSGHGAARSDDIAEAKVLLQGQRRGGTVRQQYLSATDVSRERSTGPDPTASARSSSSTRARPAAPASCFTTVGGFAKAFLDAGASAFVSCLWSVHEQPARVFVETLYEELLEGTPMSRASALARAAARDAGRPDVARLRRLRETRRRPRNGVKRHTPQSNPLNRGVPEKEGTAMARRALCVGINEFESLPQTQLAERLRQRRQRHRQGPAAARLHRRGPRRCSPTPARPRSAVMTALTKLVDTAKAGDHLVFTFSSHGTQVPNEPGGDDEPDDLDEAFACHDIRQKGDQWDRDTVIVDDELRDLFARVPDGVLLEVLLDTCHSGTGLKDLEEIHAGPAARPEAAVPAAADAQGPGPDAGAARPLAPTGRPRPQGARRADQEPRRPRRSPCSSPRASPDQTASDATFGGRSNGAFTYLFLKALKDQPGSDARRPAARRHGRSQGRRLQPALDARGPGQGEEGRLRAALVAAARAQPPTGR